MSEEYIPYGEEWKKMVMRMTKAHIVDLIADIGKERTAGEARIEQLKKQLSMVTDAADKGNDARHAINGCLEENEQLKKQLEEQVVYSEAFRKGMENFSASITMYEDSSMEFDRDAFDKLESIAEQVPSPDLAAQFEADSVLEAVLFCEYKDYLIENRKQDICFSSDLLEYVRRLTKGKGNVI